MAVGASRNPQVDQRRGIEEMRAARLRTRQAQDRLKQRQEKAGQAGEKFGKAAGKSARVGIESGARGTGAAVGALVTAPAGGVGAGAGEKVGQVDGKPHGFMAEKVIEKGVKKGAQKAAKAGSVDLKRQLAKAKKQYQQGQQRVADAQAAGARAPSTADKLFQFVASLPKTALQKTGKGLAEAIVGPLLPLALVGAAAVLFFAVGSISVVVLLFAVGGVATEAGEAVATTGGQVVGSGAAGAMAAVRGSLGVLGWFF